MPTKTGYWIRVKGGKVSDVWDYKPDAARLAAEAGWREAVEIHPDLTDNREIYTTHTFNIDVEPAQIVWGKRELSVDERKQSLIGQAKAEFQMVVNQQMRLQMSDNPAEEYDPTAVATAKDAMNARIAAVEAAVTHEDVDALM